MGTAIAWALSRVVSDRAVHMRPLLLLITAFGVFWEAGYVIDSMRRAEGDWAFALTDNGIPLSLPWRIGGVALGIALYAVGIRATVAALTRMGAANTRARMLLRLPWLAGTIFAVIAALFYTPSPFAAVKDAALEIGAAAWPLLVIPFRLRATATGAEPAIDRSLPWLAAATLGYIAFVLTLGRGIFTG